MATKEKIGYVASVIKRILKEKKAMIESFKNGGLLRAMFEMATPANEQ